MYELPVSLDDDCPIGSVAGAFASKGVVFENETQVIKKTRGKFCGVLLQNERQVVDKIRGTSKKTRKRRRNSPNLE